MREKIGVKSMKENANNIASGLLIPRLAFEALKKGWRRLSILLPSQETDLQNIKDEVWGDLSDLYYKYDDGDQKRAFREVVREISEKITEDRWQTVYSKLYRSEKTCTNLHGHAFAKGV
jgi:hypothetical protein